MRRACDPGRVAGVLSAAAMCLSTLSGCDRPAVERTPQALAHARLTNIDPDHRRPVPPLVTEVGAETGVGEVVAVDPDRLTITLRHSQAERSDWPSLVMTFRAARAEVGKARVGQRVAFRLRLRDGATEIVELSPAGGA